MAKTVADVMNMVKENEVKFVDFRFTDTRGKEQHVSVPVSAFDEDKFTSGHAFDGSSIAGWKGIEASDMLLLSSSLAPHSRMVGGPAKGAASRASPAPTKSAPTPVKSAPVQIAAKPGAPAKPAASDDEWETF